MTGLYLFPWDMFPARVAYIGFSPEVSMIVAHMINQTSWYDLTGDTSAVISCLVPDGVPEMTEPFAEFKTVIS